MTYISRSKFLSMHVIADPHCIQTADMTVSSEPHFVDTTLRYFTPPADGSKAWSNINVDPTTGERASNWEYRTHAVKVENLRGRTDATLDKNGFQFFHHPAKHTSFENDEEIEREYYPESIELLKQLTGASCVVLFDHSEFLSPKKCVDDPVTVCISQPSAADALESPMTRRRIGDRSRAFTSTRRPRRPSRACGATSHPRT
jgi:hypothetical protein